MKLSTAKDILLKSFVNGENSLDKKIPDSLYNAALKSLEDEGFLNLIETSGLGSGNYKTYRFQSLNPSAKWFAENKSFRTLSWQDYAIKGLRNFWVVFAFIITTSITFYQIYKSTSQQASQQHQIESIQRKLDSLSGTKNSDTSHKK